MNNMLHKFQQYLGRHQNTIGFIASPLAIIMFLSLIEILFSNLRGDSRIIIQPLATAVNGFVWILYAYGRKDYFLLIPNVLAFVLGILTTLVIFI